MIQLNLLPDVKKEFIRAQRTRNMVVAVSIVVIAASIGLIILFAMFVYGGQKLWIAKHTSDIKDKSSKLSQVQDLGKYLTVQNQLAHLDPLHQDKLAYSRLMNFLMVLNPREPHNIQLDNLEVISSEGDIVFKGHAPTSQAFNVYKDTLVNAELVFVSEGQKSTEKLFSDVSVVSSELGRGRDGVVMSFVVRATYNEKAFAVSDTSPELTVPNMETTQSVRSAPVFNSEQSSDGGNQ